MSHPKREIIEAIDQLLPQTQCEQCAYAGCYEYAIALAEERTEINRCPPGGMPVIRALAALLNQPVIPLDPECGEHLPPQVVRIEEEACIGCVKCIQACPIDAIVGSRRLMHTVIEAECTGCELCIPACPMNCIVIEPLPIDETPSIGLAPAQLARAENARKRYRARKTRLEKREQITETQPPSITQLAEIPDEPAKMLDLIQLAKEKFNKNYE